MTRVYTNYVNLSNLTYQNCTTITTVDLHNTPWVNNSMEAAFLGCNNLHTISNINQNVTVFNRVFYNCVNLETSPIIPSTITDLSSTFSGCTTLANSPTIPNSVQVLESTFYNCRNLVNVPTLPNSITSMISTFSNCTRLNSLPDIPNSVYNAQGICANCINLKTAPNIGNHVNSLWFAFLNCTNLTTVNNLPDSLDNLTETFYNCINLTSIPSIPNIQTSLRMTSTFAGCTNLSGNIYIPATNVTTATNCFAETNLNKDVYIAPVEYSNLSNISQTYNSFMNAGYSTSNRINGVLLINNYFPASTSDWTTSIASNNVTVLEKYIGSNTTVITPHNDFYSNKVINNSAYANNNTVEVIHLNNIEWVNNSVVYAFHNCESLKTIVGNLIDPTNMYGAFKNCSLLTDIPIIPNSVTNLCYTFCGCWSLVNAPVIQASVTNLAYTFNSCCNLINVPTIPNGVTDMRYTFYQCYKLVNAPIIPASVTDMNATFQGCSNLVYAPNLNNATNIINMRLTFDWCSCLTNAPIIPSSVTNMFGTFSSCISLQGNVYIKSNQVTNSINCFTNTGSGIKRVFIPYTYENGVNTATYNAFVAAGYDEWGTQDNVYLRDVAGSTFQVVQNPSTAYVGIFDHTNGATVDLTNFTYTNSNNNIEIQTLNTSSTDIVVPSIYTTTNTVKVIEGTTLEYKVSQEGYTSVQNTVIVNEPTRINVNLEQIVCTVNVKAIPLDATITLTCGSTTSTSGSITVAYGSEVTYKVEKVHYFTQEKTITVKSDINFDIVLATETHTITINPTPSDAIVEFMANGRLLNGSMTEWTFIADNTNDNIELQDYTGSNTDIVMPTSFTTSNTVIVAYGTVLTYVVKKDGYTTQTATFTVTADQTIDITLVVQRKAVNVDGYEYTLNSDLYLTKYTGTETTIDTPVIEIQ